MADRRARFFELVGLGLAELTLTGEVRLANPALGELLQCAPEDLIGQDLLTWVHRQDRPAVRAALHQTVAFDGARFTTRLLTPSGPVAVMLWLRRYGEPGHSGRGFIAQIHDTSEWVRAEERLALALEASGAAYFELAPDLSWRQLDASAARVLGHPLEQIPASGDALRGWFMQQVRERDRNIVDCGFTSLTQGEHEAEMQFHLRSHDGGMRCLRIIARVGERNSDGQPERITGIVHDITQAQREAERIEHIAHHDPLTDLPNRSLLMDRIRSARERLTRDGTQFALLIMDLDHFKEVNDTLGHPVGDELLQATARRLEGAVRGTDSVARLGGDEFAIVQTDVHAPSNCAQLAKKVLAELHQPFKIRGHEIRTGTSIGAVVATSPNEDEDALFAMADVALYEAKEQRGCFRLHSRDMAMEVQRQAQLTSDLQIAVNTQSLELVFVPQDDLLRRRTVAVQALARWTHPTLGPIAPSEFMPRAEDSGLMVALGQQVLRRTLAFANQLPEEIAVSVHLSPTLLGHRRFKQDLLRDLKDIEVEPKRLHLAVDAETLRVADAPALQALTAVTNEGVHLVVDNFGVGAVHLEHLSQLNLHKIRLCEALAQGLRSDGRPSRLIHCALALAKVMGTKVVATGIDDPETLSAVLQLGIPQGQGLFVGPALSESALIASLEPRQ